MKSIDVYFDGVLVCNYSNYDRIIPDNKEKIYLVMNDKDEVIGSIPFSYMILKKNN